MDDTAILATSRDKLEAKIQKLKSCVDEIGMVMHPSKSMYLSVNSPSSDLITIDNIVLHKTGNLK